MSGIVSGVGKVFKKVAKTVKKVAPIVLMAGALFFTAGAALGVSTMGWSGAVQALTSKMGATGLLGKVLTGAITHAGYGAAVGGGVALITGKDPMKGMQMGALGGAITGGVTGAWSGMQPTTIAGGANRAQMIGGTGGAPGAVGSPVDPLGAVAAKAATPPPRAGLMSRFWDQVKDSEVAGHAVGGLGEGMMSMAGSADEAEATRRAAELRLTGEREGRQATRENYAGRAGLLTQQPRDAGAASTLPSPGARFDPRIYGGQYVYNEEERRVVFIPVQTA